MDISKLRLRDFKIDDIIAHLDYVFRSPPGFIFSLGVDPAKLGAEADVRGRLEALCHRCATNESALMPNLAITYDDKLIGAHLINQIEENQQAIFHSHLYLPEYRGKGLTKYTYPIAAKIFIDRFKLNRLLYKTPALNRGAIRVKEKLGIREIGSELISFGIIKDNTPARVFELRADEVDNLIRKSGFEIVESGAKSWGARHL